MAMGLQGGTFCLQFLYSADVRSALGSLVPGSDADVVS